MAKASNRTLMESGWAPAALVARVLGKSLTWVHKMVADGEWTGCNDLRFLYIEVASVELFYAGHPALAGSAGKLREALVEELRVLGPAPAGSKPRPAASTFVLPPVKPPTRGRVRVQKRGGGVDAG